MLCPSDIRLVSLSKGERAWMLLMLSKKKAVRYILVPSHKFAHVCMAVEVSCSDSQSGSEFYATLRCGFYA